MIEAEMVNQSVVWLKEAARIMQMSGGDTVVRESAKGVWDWLRTKFEKPSAAAKIEALEAAPEDEAAAEKVGQLLNDAVQDGEIEADELRGKIAGFEEAFTVAMPEKAAVVKRNIATIKGSGNVSIQDVQDSTINVNTGS